MSLSKFSGLDVDSYRYERKFYIPMLTRHEVEQIVRLHPANFREIYHKRQINNLYFDTNNGECFLDNVSGVSSRVKIRLRWYGPLTGVAKKPVLEFKFRRNLLVGKVQYELNEILIGKRYSCRSVRGVIRKSELPERIKAIVGSLDITLQNSYERTYFLSADGLYRITVDSNLRFNQLSSVGSGIFQTPADFYETVLEIKYPENACDGAQAIAGRFPFRLTKGSKYVIGLEMSGGYLA